MSAVRGQAQVPPLELAEMLGVPLTLEQVRSHICQRGVQTTDTALTTWFGCSNTTSKHVEHSLAVLKGCDSDRNCEQACTRLSGSRMSEAEGAGSCLSSELTSCGPAVHRHFDGLGHYLEAVIHVLVTKRAHGAVWSFSRVFEESLTLGSMYLQDVPAYGSLYCHNRADMCTAPRTPNSSAPSNFDCVMARYQRADVFLRRHWSCFRVPPLDRWFGLEPLIARHEHSGQTPLCQAVWLSQAPVSSSTRSIALPFSNNQFSTRNAVSEDWVDAWAEVLEMLQRGYWREETSRTPCGHQVKSFSAAIHLRLGDMLGPRVRANTPRIRRSLQGLVHGLSVLQSLCERLRKPIRITVVADLQADTRLVDLPEIFQRFNVSVPLSFRSVADLTPDLDTAGRLYPAQFRGAEGRAPTEVYILRGGHPLYDLHCLASADILVPSDSFFSTIATYLNRGLKVDAGHLGHWEYNFEWQRAAQDRMGQGWVMGGRAAEHTADNMSALVLATFLSKHM